LLTAYPVAVLQQIRGNTCEPAVTQYCHQVAGVLKRLRAGHAAPTRSRGFDSPPRLDAQGEFTAEGRDFVYVDYFFEVFSLQLQTEYQGQAMRTQTPAMAAQHIIFNLRNHFENIVDRGNLDDRRVPIMRKSPS
jgi:hypothetical protein